MKVLVTGCAGFIGAAVTRMLCETGHTVYGIDNLNDAYDPAIKRWRLESLTGLKGFKWGPVDITDREALSAVFERNSFDTVVNLAARAGLRQSTANPWTYYETNVIGTLNLLERCRQSQVDRFVLASSSSVYGNESVPFSEHARADRPLSPYAASKMAAEDLSYSYYHLYGINIVALRFFTVYGPAGRPDMSMFRFIRWITEGDEVVIFGDGHQQRDFTYVEDIARGVVAATASPDGYEVINLGSDRPVELRYVIGKIEERVGRKAKIDYQPPNPLDIHATWANIAKATEFLDWQPRVSIDEGIDCAVDWYLKNRSWAGAVGL